MRSVLSQGGITFWRARLDLNQRTQLRVGALAVRWIKPLSHTPKFGLFAGTEATPQDARPSTNFLLDKIGNPHTSAPLGLIEPSGELYDTFSKTSTYILK